MIFSVFDYETRNYRYYEGNGSAPPTAWFRSPTGPRTPEALAVRIPAGARYQGTGPMPHGVIATSEPGVGSPDAAGNSIGPVESPWKKVWFIISGIVMGVYFGRRF